MQKMSSFLQEFSKNEKFLYKLGYRVNENLEIICPNNQKVNTHNSHGYLHFKVQKSGIRFNVRLHRFIAYTLYGDKIYEKGICVRHLDGNSLNNHISNLKLGTHSENMLDKPKELRQKNAQNNIRYDKFAVREFYNACKSYKKTMQQFNISSKGTLNNILTRKDI